MSEMTNVNIRMDKELKKQFETFCNDVGMSMTTAFTIFAKKAVREQRIPFEIGGERPNAETLEAIAEVQQMKADTSVESQRTVCCPRASIHWLRRPNSLLNMPVFQSRIDT